MYEYKCKVIHVVDGDTVDVEIDLGFHITKVDRIRFLGINTPELHDSNPDIRAKAQQAKARVEELAPSIVRIATKLDKQDKYGRILGTLFTDTELNVNETLVTEGLAVPFMV